MSPWFGNVVNVDDPLEAGRLQVRITGIHGSGIPDDALPWAQPNQTIESAAVAGLGKSPTGVAVGSLVWGIFMDGEAKQMPLIIGTLGGMTDGVSDVAEIARGVNNLDKGTQPYEPPSQYNAKYPYNKTTTTSSGHVVEIDDTPGSERIHIFHRTGSYQEFNPDGSISERAAGSSFEIVMADKTVYVGGDMKIVVEGTADIHSVGDCSILTEGDAMVFADKSLSLKSPEITIQETDTDLDLSVAKDASAIRANGALIIFDDEEPEGGSVDDTLTSEFPPPGHSESPEIRGEESATPKASTPVSCLDMNISGNTIPRGSPLYNTKLSRNYTLGQLSVGTVLSKTPIRGQGGLSAADIVCNLKAVAENILEPMRAAHPGFNINSGFRAGAGKSQHLRGMAVDLQWPRLTNTQMFEIAQWAARNLPVDQLIVEHGNKLWLHISYNRTATRQRGKLTTMVNGRYSNGLTLHRR